MNTDPNCIFCKIASRQSPAAIVYDDVDTMAFLDIHPIASGHTLVIPKNHYRNLYEFDEASGQGLMRAQRLVALALRTVFNSDGLTVLQSNERAGGQSVFHYHAHLVPRFVGDGLMTRPEQLRERGTQPHDGLPLAELAAKIREKIEKRNAQSSKNIK